MAVDRADAYLILNLLPGIGPLRVSQLLTLYESPEAVLGSSEAALARVPGIGDRLARVLASWREHCDLETEKALVQRGGVHVLTREDPAYPALLREIHDPPLCLYVRGSVEALERCRAGISMVGSRRTTTYGVHMAEHLAMAAAYAGWPVVSGLARGIDTAVHEAVLRAGGCTLAVLGAGLGLVCPQENVPLAQRIVARGGALVSEFPMMFPPDKRTFPMRNRIISGLTQGTVVVEAGASSGSLITAAQALEQGRQVFAVPGRVDCPQSRGCHALIKDGAKLTETFEDIAEEFARLPGMALPSTPGPPRPPTGNRESGPQQLTLAPLEERLLALLGDGDVSIDDLIRAAEAPPSHVLSALLMLEMRRLVRQLPGRRVVRAGSEHLG
ncbi:MAG: DNA-processing protein DprA [Lentisphaeria bacterium]|nr:DNA-processing protein DprA [Lentisphaeria bacterium]